MKYSIPENMKACPSVFAVRDTYQLIILFECDAVVWVEINGECYYDEVDGILRSNRSLHKIEVPMNILDSAGKYTVVYRKMLDRKPYFPESEEPISIDFEFHPIADDKINIYHLSDTHGMTEQSIDAAEDFGKNINLLVLNGDIAEHSGAIEHFEMVYQIASAVTGGHIPIVFSRGNHDTRGKYAELFPEYMPTCNGRLYYTFRLGSLWGLVLDCGEDKPDTNAEYGGTVRFHGYRLKETEFIKQVIENAENEYAAAGVKHRLVICHIPFTRIAPAPFDIEQDIYRSWTELICGNIKPELMLFGHTHNPGVFESGSELDSYGLLSCPAIVGGAPLRETQTYIGCGVTLSDGEPEIEFNEGGKQPDT